MLPLARIVDSLSNSRVLYTFTDPDDTTRRKGIAVDEKNLLGEPTWDTSIHGLVEGTRTITLPLRNRGASAESQMALLSELMTRTTPLYLQWRTRRDSEPVWFKLHPGISGGSLSFERVWENANRTEWNWQVTFTADAFAIGAREKIPDMQQVMADGGDIGKPIVIPTTIKGTAPTPLCLDLSTGNLSGFRCQISTWAADEDLIHDDDNDGYRAAPYIIVKRLVPNSSDNGTVAVQDDGSLRVNGAYNTSESLTGVLGTVRTQDILTTQGYLPPGQYRGMVYVSRTDGTGSCRVMTGALDESHVGQVNRLFLLNEGAVVAPQGNDIGYWVDTGRINLPAGQPFEGLTSRALGQVNEIGVSIQGDGDGNTKWVVSGLMLLPVRTSILRGAATTLSAQWSRYQENNVTMRVDGNSRRIGVLVDGTGGDAAQEVWQTYIPPALDGQFPMLQPGARNYVFFIPRVNNVETKYRFGDWGTSGTSTGWYHPRYTQLGSR